MSQTKADQENPGHITGWGECRVKVHARTLSGVGKYEGMMVGVDVLGVTVVVSDKPHFLPWSHVLSVTKN